MRMKLNKEYPLEDVKQILTQSSADFSSLLEGKFADESEEHYCKLWVAFFQCLNDYLASVPEKEKVNIDFFLDDIYNDDSNSIRLKISDYLISIEKPATLHHFCILNDIVNHQNDINTNNVEKTLKIYKEFLVISKNEREIDDIGNIKDNILYFNSVLATLLDLLFFIYLTSINVKKKK